MYDTYKDLEITEQILKAAAGSEGHKTDMAEYLLGRCDHTLITADVLLAAVRRLNSPDKMVALLLRHVQAIEIPDEMLIESACHWDGKTLDHLL
jgi:hypothetical protein